MRRGSQLFEAPANTKPDTIINLEYGVGQGQIKIVYRSRVDVWQWFDNSGPVPQFLEEGGMQ